MGNELVIVDGSAADLKSSAREIRDEIEVTKQRRTSCSIPVT